MIRIVFNDHPAGKYWAEYGPDDEHMMRHLLAGTGWSPCLKDVEKFIELANAHGVRIKLPKETP
jgi:hypothetical protein